MLVGGKRDAPALFGGVRCAAVHTVFKKKGRRRVLKKERGVEKSDRNNKKGLKKGGDVEMQILLSALVGQTPPRMPYWWPVSLTVAAPTQLRRHVLGVFTMQCSCHVHFFFIIQLRRADKFFLQCSASTLYWDT